MDDNYGSWPGGKRRGMYPSEHDAWNATHYPGTRQLCSERDGPTGRCEEDSLYGDEGHEVGPLCESCYKTTHSERQG